MGEQHRKRKKKVRVWLSEEQLIDLNNKVKESGARSREAYLRALIQKVRELQLEHPQPDFKEDLLQLKDIGYRMNELTKYAHQTRYIDMTEFDRLIAELEVVTTRLKTKVSPN